MFAQVLSSDALKIDFGKFFNLIGVAIEVRDYSSFRNAYFEIIEELKQKYSIENIPKVIKKKTISKYISSYNQRDFIRDMVGDLLSSGLISFIQITETYLKENVETYKGTIKAADFMKNELHHYYPLVPVWKYFQNVGDDAVTDVIIDHVDGKITRIWRDVGKRASSLYIVPHGDETYPCISFCDILCEYIRREVHQIRAKEIEEHFKTNLKIDFIKADFVGDSYIDDLSPKYPHSINPQNHYPHPVIFIESSEIWTEKENKSVRKAIIEDSQIYRLCLEYAEKKCGCVTFLDVMTHQRILTKGDLIICLDDNAYRRAEKLLRLNRNVGFKVLNLEMAYELLLEG